MPTLTAEAELDEADSEEAESNEAGLGGSASTGSIILSTSASE